MAEVDTRKRLEILLGENREVSGMLISRFTRCTKCNAYCALCAYSCVVCDVPFLMNKTL